MIVISLYILRVGDSGQSNNQRAGKKDGTREEEDKNVWALNDRLLWAKTLPLTLSVECPVNLQQEGVIRYWERRPSARGSTGASCSRP
jgi:hypothetical protein